MREIKFRGKARRDGEWFYGNYTDRDTKGRTHICNLNRGCLDIDPETVGQYTGLKDKNGKEIWEGDVVDLYLYPGKYTVEYHGCSFCIRDMRDKCLMGLDDYDEDHIIVIGNIHDNPELLKED